MAGLARSSGGPALRSLAASSARTDGGLGWSDLLEACSRLDLQWDLLAPLPDFKGAL